MIVVTGAGGFIGSCLVSYLNKKGHEDVIAVDAIQKENHPNLQGKKIRNYIDREIFIDWFSKNHKEVDYVFHIGARTDTAERSEQLFDTLNVSYSKSIWKICTENNIPLIYASSAATYGNGFHGYSDDHTIIPQLKPLNPYGWSKQKFDLWVLEQKTSPPIWAGFKFFNVFGPNEYHKGRMASVIFNAYNQIQQTGKVKLFKSNDPAYHDGHQKRDFIYVMDLLDVLYYFFENKNPNGIYNLGSGVANTFLSLAQNVFKAMKRDEVIEFIPMPEDINASYQNYTCADIRKLRAAGYDKTFYWFDDAVREYVKDYLSARLLY
jgi:ADP-L-glycero-D-manno-heptose 6-epimerase